MWKNCGRAGEATDDDIKRCMRFACWITEVTDIPSDYTIIPAFTLTKYLLQVLNFEIRKFLNIYLKATKEVRRRSMYSRLVGKFEEQETITKT